LSGQQSLQDLDRAVRETFGRSPGLFCMAFRDVGNPKNQLLIHADSLVHAASTMKTPVMVELFRQIEAGQLRLDDSITVKNTFSSIVDGSPYSMAVTVDSESRLYDKVGRKVTLYRLIYDMITYSSNLATNILIEIADARRVTQNMRDLGARDIRILRGVEDQKAFDAGLNNATTAFDLMLLFERLGQGDFISRDACRQMLDILKAQYFNEIIPALLPPGVEVAHKTGSITRHSHDSALVILPDGRRYALVLLSKGWESGDLAREIMAKSSRLIYDYMMGQGTR